MRFLLPKSKWLWVFLGCTSCLKMEQLPKNVIRTQNLLQSKTSAWRDPIFIPLKHTSSKSAVKTQLSTQNIVLAKQSVKAGTARRCAVRPHTARCPPAEPPLTFATPTPVNLASSSSCRRGSRLCSSSIISAAEGQQHWDYAKQRKEMAHSETPKCQFCSVSMFLQDYHAIIT